VDDGWMTALPFPLAPGIPNASLLLVKLKRRREIPYWLAEGEQTCEACGCTYTFALEMRCSDCDGPRCPQCVVVITEEVFCAGCPEERA
jgi:hypothetical protein